MASALKNTVSDGISEIYSQSKDFAGQASIKSKELYDQAREKVSDNPTLAAGIAAGVAAGVAGYLIGRGSRRSVEAPIREMAEEISEAGTGFDFSPVYKLVKLWMLYRIAL